jgi:hypothetical protein
MRRVLMSILLGAPPLLLLHWDERHGHHLPNWVFLLAVAPLMVANMMSDEEEPGPFANFVLFVLGLAAVGLGLTGYLLRDAPVLYGLGGRLVWAAPLGVVMMIAAVMRGSRDRDGS